MILGGKGRPRIKFNYALFYFNDFRRYVSYFRSLERKEGLGKNLIRISILGISEHMGVISRKFFSRFRKLFSTFLYVLLKIILNILFNLRPGSWCAPSHKDHQDDPGPSLPD